MEATVLKRIFREIEDVNADFFNLRTVITPDPHDDVTRFTFIMQPNDGAMAHLPLVGAFYIPASYPASPPVVHLYTRTGRYNVDVFHSSGQSNNRMASSMCFNILRAQGPEGNPGGGTWTAECTLSVLFATLMSAIVSLYVPQEYGFDRAEFVSIGNLRVAKKNAQLAYDQHKSSLPANIPSAPLVAATRVRATELVFPEPTITLGAMSEKTITAGPIYLQSRDHDTMVHTFAVDLSELHDKVVFSVILSNRLDDFTGRKPDTVLVRNGVTATAARKRAGTGSVTKWFYHGKPMNDGDMRLHVTVGAEQMTMAYYGDDGKRYVLGDCPVSRLTDSEIGDVRGQPFWVHIYTRNKGSEEAKIYTLDTAGFGYVFQDAEDRKFEFVDHEEEEVPLKRKEVTARTQLEPRKRKSGKSQKKEDGPVDDVDKLLAMFRAADLKEEQSN